MLKNKQKKKNVTQFVGEKRSVFDARKKSFLLHDNNAGNELTRNLSGNIRPQSYKVKQHFLIITNTHFSQDFVPCDFLFMKQIDRAKVLLDQGPPESRGFRTQCFVHIRVPECAWKAVKSVHISQQEVTNAFRGIESFKYKWLFILVFISACKDDFHWQSSERQICFLLT